MSNENGMVFVICKININPIAIPITPRSVFNGLGLLCVGECELNMVYF